MTERQDFAIGGCLGPESGEKHGSREDLGIISCDSWGRVPSFSNLSLMRIGNNVTFIAGDAVGAVKPNVQSPSHQAEGIDMASNLALFMEMLEDMCLNGVNPVTTVSIGYTPSSGSNGGSQGGGGSTGGNSGSDDELSDEEFHEFFAFTTQLLFEQICRYTACSVAV
jgi:hypothetical protein